MRLFCLDMPDDEIRKKIVLTADDFGKSELANRNILRLAKSGRLDRVSVMADGNFAPGQIEELIETGVKLDIHFELIWQKRRRNLLVDNTLRQGVVFFVNYIWGDWPVPENPRSSAKAVRREWNEQIEKFIKIFGRTPDGISSHEHTHYFTVYFGIALDLARHFNISFIRFGKKGFVGKRNSVSFILNVMRWLDNRKFLKSGVKSSSYFASLDWFENTDEIGKTASEKIIEIACHPEREEELELIEKYF
ncbi:MAG: ChbG/HpnK family deacetylase [Candidatus Moraniibacteriota bacterium]